jgi:hypothetical protein
MAFLPRPNRVLAPSIDGSEQEETPESGSLFFDVSD